jgi:hypothetical protein
MARPPIGVPLAPQWKPAGYLPAPKQARFISEAEQAAEKLPATIKAQSLKNALLKGGAKPLELEYAGMDDFVAKNQGKPVSAADVLAHLRTEGPLGKLKRVEQQVGEYGYPAEESPLTYDEQVELGLPVPQYAPNIRAPFDTSTASNSTRYHEYTVPGKKGDFTGYREVLLEDPKNRATGRRMVSGAADSETGAIDAHQADYWARYNEYPDRIAVQNIQSDAGQNYSKIKHGSDDMSALNRRLEENHRARADVLAEMNDGQPLSKERESDLRFHLAGLLEEENEIVRTSQGRFLLDITPEGMHQFTGPATSSTSPFVKDGNWKNLMARHIALQSIQGGGKPITIPTGKQMVDVEGFGLGTHNNQQKASQSAEAFNADMVRRLQKIFRGLHPDGAKVDAPRTEEALRTSISPQGAELQRRLFTIEQGNPLYQVLRNRAVEGVDVNRLDEANQRAFDLAELAYNENQRLRTPESEQKWHEAAEESNRISNELERYRNPNFLEKAGRDRSSWMENKILKILQDRTPSSASMEQLLTSFQPGDASPEFMDAAMKFVQYDRLIQEMGDPGVSSPSNVTGGGSLPGWTITPSPTAVRQALEKGLPIMSLLPLLLDQQEKK